MVNKTVSKFVSSKYAIFAIHGGGIEVGTSQIAKSIARDNFSLYIKEGKDYSEHVTSILFTDIKANELLAKIETIISIHGLKDKSKSYVMIGGLDIELTSKIEDSLIGDGFIIEQPPESLDGDNKNNICNKGKSLKGVQIEISRKLREDLYRNKELMLKFSEAIRNPLY